MLCDYHTLLQEDPYLEKYQDKLEQRAALLQRTLERLEDGQTLADLADAHRYYGFHQGPGGWVFRTLAPAARQIMLVGDFNGWDEESCPMQPLGGGDWEVLLPWGALRHGQRALVKMDTGGGTLWRVPVTSRRVWRHPQTGRTVGRVWCPSRPFAWTDAGFSPRRPVRFIYECHPGLAGCTPGFAAVQHFVLPHMKKTGYNTLLLMGVVEHADPASWGERAGHFFAPTARLGSPEALKSLVNAAHGMGITVVADMPHHGADPADSGICRYDGAALYTKPCGEGADHARFDYGSPLTQRMLLSSLRYWLEEYHLDGFRFCGVTTMLYKNGGAGQAFLSYREFFGDNADPHAALYLQLAALLCRQVRPGALLIAKEDSAMPGLCTPVSQGGLGFDLRHGYMPAAFWGQAAPRFASGGWSVGRLWQGLAAQLPTDSRLACCECSRQSRPGERPLVEQLAGGAGEGLEKSHNGQANPAVELHKMIRLATCFGSGEAYLAFMGNEFGRPGSLDPTAPRREEDPPGWPWVLRDSPFFYHRDLLCFEGEMLALAALCQAQAPHLYLLDEDAKVLGFWRGRYLLLFNFHPGKAFACTLPRGKGAWRARLLTAWQRFGGPMDDRLTPDYLDEGVVTVRLAPQSAAVYSRPPGMGGVRAAPPVWDARPQPVMDGITAQGT